MKFKYLLIITMIAGSLLIGGPRIIATHGTSEIVIDFAGQSCEAKELLEQPLPHNRYSTFIFKKSPSDVNSAKQKVLAEDPEVLHERLLSAFYAKFESRDYIAWKRQPGIPRELQQFPKEAEIKKIRADLARKVLPPDGEKVVIIPLFSDLHFTVDGFLDEPEWENLAAKILIGKGGAKTLLYLISDGSELFIACDAVDEKTEGGFDQLRFYIHPDTSYFIENERIHVSKTRAVGIRQTRIKWRRAPAVDEAERWKKYSIADWNIYALASGTWSFAGHKKYEASMNLQESGLHLETPFSAFVEVESDPIYEAGKFKNRVIIGELGNQQKPLWFVIQKVSGESGDDQGKNPLD